MATTERVLIEKLRQLSPQRLAEVEDFVDFLRRHEERAATGTRLGEALSRLDTLDLPPLSDKAVECLRTVECFTDPAAKG